MTEGWGVQSASLAEPLAEWQCHLRSQHKPLLDVTSKSLLRVPGRQCRSLDFRACRIFLRRRLQRDFLFLGFDDQKNFDDVRQAEEATTVI